MIKSYIYVCILSDVFRTLPKQMLCKNKYSRVKCIVQKTKSLGFKTCHYFHIETYFKSRANNRFQYFKLLKKLLSCHFFSFRNLCTFI